MDKKKLFNLIGVFLGIATIILGIVFIFTPADSYSTSTPADMSFGADYYTYEYEATRKAAANAAVTANNIRELASKLALYSGSVFIIAGLFISLYFFKEIFNNINFYENKNLPLVAMESTTEKIEQQEM